MTDQPTNGPTNRVTYRVACTRLKSVGAHIGQFEAQRDKLTPQMGLLGNHMAQHRAQMSQLEINQWPKAIIWLAVPLPCSLLA